MSTTTPTPPKPEDIGFKETWSKSGKQELFSEVHADSRQAHFDNMSRHKKEAANLKGSFAKSGLAMNTMRVGGAVGSLWLAQDGGMKVVKWISGGSKTDPNTGKETSVGFGDALAGGAELAGAALMYKKLVAPRSGGQWAMGLK